MYLGGFYQFPKFRQNRPKNGRFLAKNVNFFRNSSIPFEKKNVGGKLNLFQGNALIGLQIGRHVPTGTSYNLLQQILDIWLFSNFTALEMRRAGNFLPKMGNFTQKSPSLRISASVKSFLFLIILTLNVYAQLMRISLINYWV